jgi:hypothetical protein
VSSIDSPRPAGQVVFDSVHSICKEMTPNYLPLEDEPEVLLGKVVDLLSAHHLLKFPLGSPRFDIPARYEKARIIFNGDKTLMAFFEVVLHRAPPAELQRVGMELQLDGAKREVNLLGRFQGIPEGVQEAWLHRVKEAYQPVPASRRCATRPQEGAPAPKKVRKEPDMKTQKMLSKCAKELTVQITGPLELVAKTNSVGSRQSYTHITNIQYLNNIVQYLITYNIHTQGKVAVLLEAARLLQSVAIRGKTKEERELDRIQELANSDIVQCIANAHARGRKDKLSQTQLARNLSLVVLFFTRPQANTLIFKFPLSISSRQWTLAHYHASEVGANAVTDGATALALRPRYRQHYDLLQVRV